MSSLPRSSHRGVAFRLLRRPLVTTKYQAYFRVHGRRHDRGTGTADMGEAVTRVRRMIEEALAAQGPTGRRRATLEAFAASYLRDLAGGDLSPHTVAIYTHQVRAFVAFCAARGLGYVEQLHAQLVADYRSHLLTRYRPVTVHNVLACAVGPLLRAAKRQELITGDVRDWLPRAGKRPAKVARELSRGEVAGILRALRRQPDGRARAQMIRFYLWTGARRDQARNLRPEDLDLVAGTLTLCRQKADTGPRTIPMSPRVRRLLRARLRHPGARVFGAVPPGSPLRWLRQAAGAAGVRGYIKLHHFRDTFISWALNDPRCALDFHDVMCLVGHKRPAQTLAYYQPNLRRLAAKYATLR